MSYLRICFLLFLFFISFASIAYRVDTGSFTLCHSDTFNHTASGHPDPQVIVNHELCAFCPPTKVLSRVHWDSYSSFHVFSPIHPKHQTKLCCYPYVYLHYASPVFGSPPSRSVRTLALSISRYRLSRVDYVGAWLKFLDEHSQARLTWVLASFSKIGLAHLELYRISKFLFSLLSSPITYNSHACHHRGLKGGGLVRTSVNFAYSKLSTYPRMRYSWLSDSTYEPNDSFKWIGCNLHIPNARSHPKPAFVLECDQPDDIIACEIPCDLLFKQLPWGKLSSLVTFHDIQFPPHCRSFEQRRGVCLADLEKCGYQCTHTVVSYLICTKRDAETRFRHSEKYKRYRSNKAAALEISLFADSPMSELTLDPIPPPQIQSITTDAFPPPPVSVERSLSVIRSFCDAISSENLEETPCACCGASWPKNQCVPLDNVDVGILHRVDSHTTRKERQSPSDPISETSGPILLPHSNLLCAMCASSLRKDCMPKFALANGLWLGDVPQVLKDLTFIEKLVVARYRHNVCVARVDSGGKKLTANAVIFSHPVPKFYHVLPPPLDELDEVLAIMFTGSASPSEADLKRSPLLVSRNRIKSALEWLKLNHTGYFDLDISSENLAAYPEGGIPSPIIYTPSNGEATAESMSIFEQVSDIGQVVRDDGSCTFAVSGLTGVDISGMSAKTLLMTGLDHLRNGKSVLTIGQSNSPESIYHNSTLYTGLFPWLFPYGLGGLENNRILRKLSSKAHKKHLLLYHDQRFQNDEYFPYIAFNHEQIKSASSAGYIVAERSSMESTVSRIMNLSTTALDSLIARSQDAKTFVKPLDEDEKQCYKLISDLDYVSASVQGSNASRKQMRNEIKSLLRYHGSPMWFVTFAPCDFKAPICLKYAGSNMDINLPWMSAASYQEKVRLICKNPVSGARYFHKMVELFVSCMLGYQGDERTASSRGLFGEVADYYGTVEAQGRLTLHLHCLIWLKNAPSPQELRERVLADNVYAEKVLAYLESVVQGEYFHGTEEDVKIEIERASGKKSICIEDADNASRLEPEYHDPTETLPQPPPSEFPDLTEKENWWRDCMAVVDDIIYKSNRHAKHNRACQKHGLGTCKARFPREVYEKSSICPETGAITLRHLEPLLNTFSRIIAYLLRSNHDVTAILSGTAAKAIIAYVTDYITKSTLPTHSMFRAMRAVIDKNTALLAEDSMASRKERARSLMTKMVNAFSSKQELGGPQICMYLLGNPDFYTRALFNPCYWRSYVNEASKGNYSTESEDSAMEAETMAENLVLSRSKDEIVGLSKVADYTHRPERLKDFSLYEFLHCIKKRKIRKRKAPVYKDQEDSDESVHDCNEGDEPCESENVKSSMTLLDGHPQSGTHELYLVKPSHRMVPNFIGGELPRKDKGDYEYYCTTMLTLFAPWRCQNDLKAGNTKWSTAFESFDFKNYALEKMSHFNVLYECQDARDDHRAQRKKNMKGFDIGILPNVSSDDLEELDLDHEEFIALQEYIPPDLMSLLDEDDFSVSGAKGLKRLQTMRETTNQLTTCGWLDSKKPLGVSSTKGTSSEQFVTGSEKSASEWTQCLKEARQNILDERQAMLQDKSGPNGPPNGTNYSENTVRILSGDYFTKGCKSFIESDNDLIRDTIRLFSLNEAQTRAFSIIAHHSLLGQQIDRKPLRMYLGGVAGTGKSQVLKALTYFVSERRERGRLMILAPTGSAAALIDGSTYHSVLGLREGGNSVLRFTARQLAKAREALEGVDTIFFDEVSMLSLSDLYTISELLSTALGQPLQPFGGLTMIFAGDFAQMPPPGGSPLYKGNVGRIAQAAYHSGQRNTLGKCFWHQVTTVVILKENMRQKDQTEDDEAFRLALTNMRYRACTPEDFSLLNRLVLGHPSCPYKTFADIPDFKDVSIITSYNCKRDMINTHGAVRFSQERQTTLSEFYSIDDWKKTVGDRSSELQERTQAALWELPPAMTDHRAGKLSICEGMPILIKYNEATECCVTNGAEATVAGWKAIPLPESNGKQALTLLFARLRKPPKDINLPGLPVNVVPIAPQTKEVTCTLWSDTSLIVDRTQIPVLPNFAMTDFASQGRSRQMNVVDGISCKTQFSYYTALSRSTSFAGTIILGGIDQTKICPERKRGRKEPSTAGELRAEFRELEILNDITHKRCLGKLHSDVAGESRNPLIDSYQRTYGKHYVPRGVDTNLNWASAGNEDLEAPFDYLADMPCDWNSRFETNKKKRKTEETKSDLDSQPTKRQKVAESKSVKAKAAKKGKGNSTPASMRTPSGAISTETAPLGLAWDSVNHSCAYDAVLTPLLHAFRSTYVISPYAWNNLQCGPQLAVEFGSAVLRRKSFEDARNVLRRQVNAVDAGMFPIAGSLGTRALDVAMYYLKPKMRIAYNITALTCPLCGARDEVRDNSFNFILTKDGYNKILRLNATESNIISVAMWMALLHNGVTSSRCSACQVNRSTTLLMSEPLPFLIVELVVPADNLCYVKAEPRIAVGEWNYDLRGIIYYGSYHFTSRVIDDSQNSWFHDGMRAGGRVIFEGNYTGLNEVIAPDGRTPHFLLYMYRN
jgi:hypothetical protein